MPYLWVEWKMEPSDKCNMISWYVFLKIKLFYIRVVWYYMCEAKSRKYWGVIKVKVEKIHGKFGKTGLNNLSISKSQKWGRNQVSGRERSLLACLIRCKCSMEATRNSVKINLGIKVMKLVGILIGLEVTVTGQGSGCHLAFVIFSKCFVSLMSSNHHQTLVIVLFDGNKVPPNPGGTKDLFSVALDVHHMTVICLIFFVFSFAIAVVKIAKTETYVSMVDVLVILEHGTSLSCQF